MKQIYLDNNASTRVAPEVSEAMLPFLGATAANASSLHRSGQRARHAVEAAREKLAAFVGALPEEIFFTSGGTEANNLAVKGLARAGMKKGNAHLVVSAIEHPSVLQASGQCDKEWGTERSFVPADESGRVSAGSFREALRADTALACLLLVNNETGVIQPAPEISREAHQRGALFHMDACQALGKLSVDLRELRCATASFSAHKLYGPQGVGALFIRKGTSLEALFHGGHQEKNIRPGTENVAGIVGFGAAVDFAAKHREKHSREIARLSRMLYQKLVREPGAVRRNGDERFAVPNTLNLSFDGVDGPALMMNLDLAGVAVSTGSACTAGSVEPSHVLIGMGLPPERARGALRISLGAFTTEEEVLTAHERIAKSVNRLRGERVSTGKAR